LQEHQAEQAVAVLRLRVGDAIVVFDGEGAEAEARVAALSRRGATAAIERRFDSMAEPALRLTVLLSPLRSDRFEWAIQKCVELGAAAIGPVLCERTVAHPEERGKKLERWQRIAVEAAEQCGRGSVPAILPARKLAAVLAAAGTGVLLSERGGAPLGEIARSGSATVLIGPEGGWTDAEHRDALEQGWTAASLGPRILRAETAAVAAAAVLLCR
jgi:16S rRNA (uracil1498-N3)-methyltransferase